MLIGHKAQWQFLKKSVELQKLPHALLFSGPSKVGKRTLALELAKLLNCQNPDFGKRPCQTCSACQDIAKGRAPDLISITPGKKEIGIDEIRNLSWKMSLKPYALLWKVAILDKVHTLGKPAQNSFLKTLEEPKRQSLFILVTEYPAKLLPTIRSRVQEIKFTKVAQDEIEEYLNKKKTEPGKARKIVQFAAGRPGLAIDLLENPSGLKEYERKVKELEGIFQRGLDYKFQYARKLSEKSSRELNQIFEIWLIRFHQLFLAKAGSDPAFARNLEQIEKTQILINFTNVNKRLALENLMLNLGSVS